MDANGAVGRIVLLPFPDQSVDQQANARVIVIPQGDIGPAIAGGQFVLHVAGVTLVGRDNTVLWRAFYDWIRTGP